jgi:hypothetical protein
MEPLGPGACAPPNGHLSPHGMLIDLGHKLLSVSHYDTNEPSASARRQSRKLFRSGMSVVRKHQLETSDRDFNPTPLGSNLTAHRGTSRTRINSY